MAKNWWEEEPAAPAGGATGGSPWWESAPAAPAPAPVDNADFIKQHYSTDPARAQMYDWQKPAPLAPKPAPQQEQNIGDIFHKTLGMIGQKVLGGHTSPPPPPPPKPQNFIDGLIQAAKTGVETFIPGARDLKRVVQSEEGKGIGLGLGTLAVGLLAGINDPFSQNVTASDDVEKELREKAERESKAKGIPMKSLPHKPIDHTKEILNDAATGIIGRLTLGTGGAVVKAAQGAGLAVFGASIVKDTPAYLEQIMQTEDTTQKFSLSTQLLGSYFMLGHGAHTTAKQIPTMKTVKGEVEHVPLDLNAAVEFTRSPNPDLTPQQKDAFTALYKEGSPAVKEAIKQGGYDLQHADVSVPTVYGTLINYVMTKVRRQEPLTPAEMTVQAAVNTSPSTIIPRPETLVKDPNVLDMMARPAEEAGLATAAPRTLGQVNIPELGIQGAPQEVALPQQGMTTRPQPTGGLAQVADLAQQAVSAATPEAFLRATAQINPASLRGFALSDGNIVAGPGTAPGMFAVLQPNAKVQVDLPAQTVLADFYAQARGEAPAALGVRDTGVPNKIETFSAFKAHPSAKQMSPDQYLRSVYANSKFGEGKTPISFEKWLELQRLGREAEIKKYSQEMSAGAKFPVLTIDNQARTQDGVGRALAAKLAHLDKVPVLHGRVVLDQNGKEVRVATPDRVQRSLKTANKAQAVVDAMQTRANVGKSLKRVKQEPPVERDQPFYTPGEHRKMLTDYADELRAMDKEVGGVTRIPGEDGAQLRKSTNSPFYREYYKAHKKPPTKADYEAEAHRQLMKGTNERAKRFQEAESDINPPKPDTFDADMAKMIAGIKFKKGDLAKYDRTVVEGVSYLRRVRGDLPFELVEGKEVMSNALASYEHVKRLIRATTEGGKVDIRAIGHEVNHEVWANILSPEQRQAFTELMQAEYKGKPEEIGRTVVGYNLMDLPVAQQEVLLDGIMTAAGVFPRAKTNTPFDNLVLAGETYVNGDSAALSAQLRETAPTYARALIKFFEDAKTQIGDGTITDTVAEELFVDQGGKYAADRTGSMSDKLKAWFKDFWNAIKKAFGAQYDQAREIYKQSFEGQFKEQLSGKPAKSSGDLAPARAKLKDEGAMDNQIIYHATPETFTRFDTDRMEGGAAWFTNDRTQIDKNTVGAVAPAGKKLNVMERQIKPGVKLADEALDDKLTTDQLIADGYRGVVYEGGEDGAVWTKLFFPNEDTVVPGAKRDMTPDYGMSHRPSEYGPGYDIAEGGESIPADVYDHPEHYFNMNDEAYKESFAALKSIHNKPDAEVKIYRASPKNELNRGDWISLSKIYAERSGVEEGTPVHGFTVKAKDIQFAGDDLNEFGYYPAKKSKLKLADDQQVWDEFAKASQKLEGELTRDKEAMRGIRRLNNADKPRVDHDGSWLDRLTQADEERPMPAALGDVPVGEFRELTDFKSTPGDDHRRITEFNPATSPRAIVDNYDGLLELRRLKSEERLTEIFKGTTKEQDKALFEAAMEYQIDGTTSLDPELQKVFNQTTKLFESVGQDAYVSGRIRGLQENYITQIWDTEKIKDTSLTVEQIAFLRGASTTTTRFSLEKTVKSYKLGISLGLKPKYDRLSDVIRTYLESDARAAAGQFLTDDMLALGDTHILAGANGLPPGWKPVTKIGGLKGYFVSPEAAKALKPLDTVSAIRENKIGRVALKTNETAKQVILAGDLFLLKNYLFDSNAVVGGFPRLLYHASQVTPEVRTKLVALGGLKLAAGNPEMTNSLFGKVGRKLLSPKNPYFWADTISFTAGDKLRIGIASLMYNKLKAKGKTDVEAATEAVRFAQNTFGRQNAVRAGQSQTTQDLLKLGMMAPDYTISRFKTFGRAAKGAIPGVSTAENRRYTFSLLHKTLLAVLMLEMLNLATSGHGIDKNDEDHKLDLEVMKPDGTKYYVNFLGVVKTDIRFFQGVADLAQGDTTTMTRFIGNKGSTLERVAQLLVTGKDYRGEDIVNKLTDSPTEKIQKLSLALGANFVPLPVSGIVSPNTHGDGPAPRGIEGFFYRTLGFDVYDPKSMPGVVRTSLNELETAKQNAMMEAYGLVRSGKEDEARKIMEAFNRKAGEIGNKLSTVNNISEVDRNSLKDLGETAALDIDKKIAAAKGDKSPNPISSAIDYGVGGMTIGSSKSDTGQERAKENAIKAAATRSANSKSLKSPGFKKAPAGRKVTAKKPRKATAKKPRGGSTKVAKVKTLKTKKYKA